MKNGNEQNSMEKIVKIEPIFKLKKEIENKIIKTMYFKKCARLGLILEISANNAKNISMEATRIICNTLYYKLKKGSEFYTKITENKNIKEDEILIKIKHIEEGKRKEIKEEFKNYYKGFYE